MLMTIPLSNYNTVSIFCIFQYLEFVVEVIKDNYFLSFFENIKNFFEKTSHFNVLTIFNII